jgi:hypothetical protein
MNETKLRVLKSVYALSDDIDYNLYEAVDIAEYARLDIGVVETELKKLYADGFLGECMSLEDDGMETFHVTHKALAYLE